MIARYTRPELGAVWTDEARMTAWRDVEVAAAEALETGPTADELDAIRAATFTVEAVGEREAVTDHDVAAFIDVLSASAGPGGRWIHFGLTSSDVLDTALGLQLQHAGRPILEGARDLAIALAERAREFGDTICTGRTHGVHAEPTTFGLKLAAGRLLRRRNARRSAERAFEQPRSADLRCLGTYASPVPLGPVWAARVDREPSARSPACRTPSCWGDRARRRRARAFRHGIRTAAHGCAEVGSPSVPAKGSRRCPTSATHHTGRITFSLVRARLRAGL